jgi:DNA-directed RNA polymerase sigma subunit (sigma70/sigma32)
MTRPEIELIKKAREAKKQADPDDHVNQWMRWALYMAGKYRRKGLAYGIPWEDLQGEALVALVNANAEWPSSEAAKGGGPFRAYATVAIKNRFEDLFRKASLVHLSSPAARQEIFKVKNAIEKKQLEQGGGYVPEDELAKELGWPVERVKKYLRLARMTAQHLSVDEPLREDESDSELFESVHVDGRVNIESEVIGRIELEHEREWLCRATAELPPLARTSIVLTFGLQPGEDVPNPTIEQVIRTAIGHSDNTKLGLKKLRGRRQDDKGDMPEMVSGRRTFAHSGSWSPETATSKKGQYRAIDTWRRYTGKQPPPALSGANQSAGTMGS